MSVNVPILYDELEVGLQTLRFFPHRDEQKVLAREILLDISSRYIVDSLMRDHLDTQGGSHSLLATFGTDLAVLCRHNGQSNPDYDLTFFVMEFSSSVSNPQALTQSLSKNRSSAKGSNSHSAEKTLIHTFKTRLLSSRGSVNALASAFPELRLEHVEGVFFTTLSEFKSAVLDIELAHPNTNARTNSWPKLFDVYSTHEMNNVSNWEFVGHLGKKGFLYVIDILMELISTSFNIADIKLNRNDAFSTVQKSLHYGWPLDTFVSLGYMKLHPSGSSSLVALGRHNTGNYAVYRSLLSPSNLESYIFYSSDFSTYVGLQNLDSMKNYYWKAGSMKNIAPQEHPWPYISRIPSKEVIADGPEVTVLSTLTWEVAHALMSVMSHYVIDYEKLNVLLSFEDVSIRRILEVPSLYRDVFFVIGKTSLVGPFESSRLVYLRDIRYTHYDGSDAIAPSAFSDSDILSVKATNNSDAKRPRTETYYQLILIE